MRSAASRPRRSSCACRFSMSFRTGKGADGVGVPEPATGERSAASALMRDENMDRALDEGRALLDAPRSDSGVKWICSPAGSPYYNPHIHAAGVVPAARRLPAAGRSAPRRRAADRRDGAG